IRSTDSRQAICEHLHGRQCKQTGHGINRVAFESAAQQKRFQPSYPLRVRHVISQKLYGGSVRRVPGILATTECGARRYRNDGGTSGFWSVEDLLEAAA